MDRKVFVGLQFLGIMVVAVFAATGVWADSATVSYQGVLRDAALAPVPDNTYQMRFSIWDDATAGTKRWGDETHEAVATRNGLFSVYLGSSVLLGNVFTNYGALWLQIEANTGSGLELYNPRVPLASVPYAQHALSALNATNAVNATNAGNADTVDGQHAAAFAPTVHNHSASQITSGTLAFGLLPVGTGSTQVSRGDHSHSLDALSDVTAGAPATGNVLAWNGSQWTNQESPAQSGVREICFSGWTNGNAQVDCRVSLSGSSCVLVSACFNHAGYIGTYGCSRQSFVARNSGWTMNADSIRDIQRYDSGNAGYWEFYQESNHTLLIRKVPGSYGGDGYYFVTVKGTNILGKG